MLVRNTKKHESKEFIYQNKFRTIATLIIKYPSSNNKQTMVVHRRRSPVVKFNRQTENLALHNLNVSRKYTRQNQRRHL